MEAASPEKPDPSSNKGDVKAEEHLKNKTSPNHSGRGQGDGGKRARKRSGAIAICTVVGGVLMASSTGLLVKIGFHSLAIWAFFCAASTLLFGLNLTLRSFWFEHRVAWWTTGSLVGFVFLGCAIVQVLVLRHPAVASQPGPTQLLMAETKGDNSPVIQAAPGSTVNFMTTEPRPRHLAREQFNKLVGTLKLMPKEDIRVKAIQADLEAAQFGKEIITAFDLAGFQCTGILVMGATPSDFPNGVTVVWNRFQKPNPELLTSIKNALTSVGVEIGPATSHPHAKEGKVCILVGPRPSNQAGPGTTINYGISEATMKELLRDKAIAANREFLEKYPYGYALLGAVNGKILCEPKWSDIHIQADWDRVSLLINQSQQAATLHFETFAVFETNGSAVYHNVSATFPYVQNKPSRVWMGPLSFWCEVLDADKGVFLVGFK